MTGIKKRLGSLLGPEGLAPHIVATQTTQVPPAEPADVDFIKTGDRQYRVEVRLPRGLDGDPTAVADFSQAMAAEATTEGTPGNTAISALIDQRAVTGSGVTRIVASKDPNYPLAPGELLVLLKEHRPQFLYDFSTFPLGSGAPDGWVEPWTVNGDKWRITEDDSVAGGRTLNNIATGADRLLLVPEETREHSLHYADQELVFKHKNTLHYERAVLRASGEAGTETGYWSGHSDNHAGAGQYLNGQLTTFGRPVTQGSEWFISRLRVEGNTLYSRHWPATDTEPTVWHLTRQDLEIQGPGDVGIMGSGRGSFAWIGFGFDGAAAPKGPAL